MSAENLSQRSLQGAHPCCGPPAKIRCLMGDGSSTVLRQPKSKPCSSQYHTPSRLAQKPCLTSATADRPFSPSCESRKTSMDTSLCTSLPVHPEMLGRQLDPHTHPSLLTQALLYAPFALFKYPDYPR